MKNFIKEDLFLLIIILFLGGVLRFWNLSNNPPSLTWDESALGYNAYSILQTGRDEYGSFLPIQLKSFGDYKPAVYAYVTIPFIAIFGLNEFSVRVPSAIAGILSILILFLLVRKITGKSKLGLLSALFLAISPWHIQFSRPAFEANLALLFNTAAIYFFVAGLEQQRKLVLSAIMFGLSLFTYQSSRLFVPLISVFLVAIFFSSFKWRKKAVKTALIISLIFYFGLADVFLTGQTLRLSTLNFFAYQRSQEQLNQISSEDSLKISSSPFQILHGEWWAYTRGLTERYLIYFSPKMLFVDGDYSPRHRVPDLGLLYYFSLILIPLGVTFLLKNLNKQNSIILIWLILAPVPAVLSRDLISSLRALNMVIPYAIFDSLGFYFLMTFLKSKTKYFFYSLVALIVSLMVFNISIYLDRYFIHAPVEYSDGFVYGNKQIFEKLKSLDIGNYKKIVITDDYQQPYIYYLFYNQYPPEKFQKEAILEQKTVDVGTVRKVDNIEFRHVFWPSDRGEKNSLFIGTEEELPLRDILPFEEYKLLDTVNFLDGRVAFRIVETHE